MQTYIVLRVHQQVVFVGFGTRLVDVFVQRHLHYLEAVINVLDTALPHHQVFFEREQVLLSAHNGEVGQGEVQGCFLTRSVAAGLLVSGRRPGRVLALQRRFTQNNDVVLQGLSGAGRVV